MGFPYRRVALVVHALLAASCIFVPPHYDFGSPPTVANPVRGGTPGGGMTIAHDGKTEYQMVAFTPEEACVLAKLDGPEPQRVQGMTFSLRGFEREDADPRSVPSVASARVTVKETSTRFQSMPSGGYAVPVTSVEVCFAKPTTVVTAKTRYMVVGVDYDGTAEHDGVWRFAD